MYTIDKIYKSNKGFMAVSKETNCSNSPTATYMYPDGSYRFGGIDVYQAAWEKIEIKFLPEKAKLTLEKEGWQI